MARLVKDLSGQKFGRLLVLRLAERIDDSGARSHCRCDCGNLIIVRNSNLIQNSTKSCGCLARESASRLAKTGNPRRVHGMAKTATYRIWMAMLNRCNNPKHKAYSRYGGRGITVCKEWADPEKGVFAFIEAMGPSPSSLHTIDRIDSSKGYESSNCRWATRVQQNQNIGLKKSNTSGFKGLTRQRSGKWLADIRANGKRYHLGIYDTKEEAALAYNLASIELHGSFGVRNVLPSMSQKVSSAVRAKVKNFLPKE